jgi:hypothetical protein
MGEEAEDRSCAALALRGKIRTQLTGTELHRIAHGDRDSREQRAPKLLAPIRDKAIVVGAQPDQRGRSASFKELRQRHYLLIGQLILFQV